MFLLQSVLILRLCTALEGNNFIFSPTAKSFLSVSRGHLVLSKDAAVLKISPEKKHGNQKVQIERCASDDDTCRKGQRPGDVLNESLEINQISSEKIQLMNGDYCYGVDEKNQTISEVACDINDVKQELIVIPSGHQKRNGNENERVESDREGKAVARKRKRENNVRDSTDEIGTDAKRSKVTKNSRNHRTASGNREHQRYSGKERQQVEFIEQLLGPNVMADRFRAGAKKRPDAESRANDDGEDDGSGEEEEKGPNPNKDIPAPFQMLTKLMTVNPKVLKKLMSTGNDDDSEEESNARSLLVGGEESQEEESGDELSRKARRAKQVNKRKKRKSEHRMQNERRESVNAEKGMADEKRDCVRNPKNNMCYYQLSSDGSLKPVLWPKGIKNTDELCEKRKEWRSTMVCLGRS